MARPEQVEHGYLHGKRVRLRWDALGEVARGHAGKRGYQSDTVAKVVMVSGMGDCGLSQNLDAEHGYDLRVMPWQLVDAVTDEVFECCAFHCHGGDGELSCCDECDCGSLFCKRPSPTTDEVKP